MRTKLSKALALFLALLMVCGNFSFAVLADETTETVSDRRTMAQWNEILNTGEYEEFLADNADTPRGTETIVIDATKFDAALSSKDNEVLFNVGGDGEPSLYTSDRGKATWKVNVPAEGLYTITLNCYPGDGKLAEGDREKSTDVERILYVNGKVPFSEARSVTVSKRWAAQYEMLADGKTHGFDDTYGFLKDVAGNDIRPDNISAVTWTNYTVKDSTGYYAEPLEFLFKAGENTITLEATREPMNIKSITLTPKKELPTYEEYVAQHPATNGQDVIYLEAEIPTYQSDESIYPLVDRTSAVSSPQDPQLQILNYMGGTENFKTVGQWVEYEFEVKTEGFYGIALRFKQNDLSGMFASRTIYIDGEIPFAECTNLRFDYSKDWKCANVTDGTADFSFYLTPGKHTLRLEVSLGQFADIIRQVESSLNNINSCYLDIMKLTGADPDEYRDYGFSRLMPNTISTMLIESRNLYNVSKYITELCGEKGSQTATLDKVAFLLEKMGRSEDEIAPNLDNLKTYIGTLGTWLNGVRSQPVRMDYIVIQPTANELPKDNASFGQAIAFEFKAFIASFFTDYSTMGAVSEEATEKNIEVWTTEGRDQAKILKNLVSSDFTTESNIGVNVKLVAAGTLLPSVLSGQGPDAFLGAAGVDVINYAIRNAVIPLNDFEGFDDIISEFNDDSVTPVTLYGTTYGLPERAGFYMMFVRIDILADLGLEIPKTWDDLLAMLPVLQANNMSIGLNKEYDIFLYQMGGDRFADDGLRCGLDSNVALEAFEKYTRFFTDYSFPFTFDGPNRFRTGEMPILIADYSTTYNQLTVFATEIDGLWEMAPLPGTYREDGTFNNDAFNTVAATIMLHGTSDQASTWEFMKWYCGHEAQAAYGSDLVTTIGQAAKYNTANRLAIAEMPWTTSEYEALSTQFENLSAVTNYPGAYIFARYLNFALLSVVNEGQDPVVELQGYVATINKEITRKREEFDLPILEAGKTYETSPEVKAEMEAWLAANAAK
ncbi:MAG: extracellular solute-binding protein [Clostridia bacterium]|nr:extracellular solute-binding protein [Clostridia bacterium]